jgi:hypothetical protein
LDHQQLIDEAGNPVGREWLTIPATAQEVRVDVDFDRLALDYGPRACRNKGRRTRQLFGLVVVTAKPAEDP